MTTIIIDRDTVSIPAGGCPWCEVDAERERAEARAQLEAIRSELVTDAERDRGGLAVLDLTDDEVRSRVRRGVEVENEVVAYLRDLDGPLGGDPAAALARLRRAVGAP